MKFQKTKDSSMYVAPVLQPIRATSYYALNELFLSKDLFINWRGKPWKESPNQTLMMYL